MAIVTRSTTLPNTAGSGRIRHFVTVDYVPPIVQGNRDMILNLGDTWSWITPCRTRDYKAPLPNILGANVEWFLMSLDGVTVVAYVNLTNYIAVINTVDARVQVAIPSTYQQSQAIAEGDYKHALKVTTAEGVVSFQAKGRVHVRAYHGTPPTQGAEPETYLESPDTGIGTLHPFGQTLSYEFDQAVVGWNIPHNLGRFPSVTTIDTAGSVLYGDVTYIDDDNIFVAFSAPVAGTAYLN